LTICPTATTSYTAEVTYALCNGLTQIETEAATVTVTKNKIWNGTASTSWATASNWTPTGVPTAANCVEVPNVPNTCIVGSNAFAYSVDVLNGGRLQVNSLNNLTVTNKVTVYPTGSFVIKNSGSLVQIDNIANLGIIDMERISQPMYRYDYTYWNSPVTQASGFTLGALSPATLADKYYSWTPSVGGSFGNWQQESAATIMNPQKGYIVRAPQTFSLNPAIKVPYTANFIGTPNNGNISSGVSHGLMGALATDDKWNLLGNPYPSAIRAITLLNLGQNIPLIDGTLYFWTHNSAPGTQYPDPFYGDFVINYSGNDYATWNNLGALAAFLGGPVPTGYIAAGEAFFVRSLGLIGTASFNNSMRVASNNNQFFKSTATAIGEVDEPEFEKHRIWLNMANDNSFSQILVGYAEGATTDWDRGLDGTRFSSSTMTLYSLIPSNKLAIQGRPLPFDVNDQVPLGYTSPAAANYSIRIDHTDGLFETQPIFLEDKLLNIIYDIRLAPYQFTTDAGTFDDRFVLRYYDSALATQHFNTVALTAYISANQLWVRSSDEIELVQVYDIAGKLVKTFNPSDGIGIQHWNFDCAKGAYLVKVKTASGLYSRKLMN
jgi:hypothetical protein